MKLKMDGLGANSNDCDHTLLDFRDNPHIPIEKLSPVLSSSIHYQLSLLGSIENRSYRDNNESMIPSDYFNKHSRNDVPISTSIHIPPPPPPPIQYIPTTYSKEFIKLPKAPVEHPHKHISEHVIQTLNENQDFALAVYHNEIILNHGNNQIVYGNEIYNFNNKQLNYNNNNNNNNNILYNNQDKFYIPIENYGFQNQIFHQSHNVDHYDKYNVNKINGIDNNESNESKKKSNKKLKETNSKKLVDLNTLNKSSKSYYKVSKMIATLITIMVKYYFIKKNNPFIIHNNNNKNNNNNNNNLFDEHYNSNDIINHFSYYIPNKIIESNTTNNNNNEPLKSNNYIPSPSSTTTKSIKSTKSNSSLLKYSIGYKKKNKMVSSIIESIVNNNNNSSSNSNSNSSNNYNKNNNILLTPFSKLTIDNNSINHNHNNNIIYPSTPSTINSINKKPSASYIDTNNLNLHDSNYNYDNSLSIDLEIEPKIIYNDSNNYKIDIPNDFWINIGNKMKQKQINIEPNAAVFALSQLLISSSRLSMISILVALKLVERILFQNQLLYNIILLDNNNNMNMSINNKHFNCKTENELVFSLLIGSIILSNKFSDDSRYANSWWSKITNISLNKINEIEKEFLINIEWSLNINKKEFNNWDKIMKSFAKWIWE